MNCRLLKTLQTAQRTIFSKNAEKWGGKKMYLLESLDEKKEPFGPPPPPPSPAPPPSFTLFSLSSFSVREAYMPRKIFCPDLNLTTCASVCACGCLRVCVSVCVWVCVCVCVCVCVVSFLCGCKSEHCRKKRPAKVGGRICPLKKHST